MAMPSDRLAKKNDHLAKMNCLDSDMDTEYPRSKIDEGNGYGSRVSISTSATPRNLVGALFPNALSGLARPERALAFFEPA